MKFSVFCRAPSARSLFLSSTSLASKVLLTTSLLVLSQMAKAESVTDDQSVTQFVTPGDVLIVDADVVVEDDPGVIFEGDHGRLSNFGLIGSLSNSISLDGQFGIGIVNNTEGIISGGTEGILAGGGAVLSGGILNFGLVESAQSHAISITDTGTEIFGDVINSLDADILGTVSGINAENGAEISGSIINFEGATISGDEDGITAKAGAIFSGRISNSGTIEGFESSGISVSGVGSEISGDISNISNGNIFGRVSAISADEGAEVSGWILNEFNGFVSGEEDGISARGGAVLSGGIRNSGTLEGMEASGIVVSGKDTEISGDIWNDYGGFILGETHGINAQGGAEISGEIRNSDDALISGNSTGIRAQGGALLSGGIRNSGFVEGASSAGIAVLDASTEISGDILNEEGGSISGELSSQAISRTRAWSWGWMHLVSLCSMKQRSYPGTLPIMPVG